MAIQRMKNERESVKVGGMELPRARVMGLVEKKGVERVGMGIRAGIDVKEELGKLGQEVKAYRKGRGLSQRAFAKEVGCSWQIVSHLECESGDAPSFGVYVRIRRVIGGEGCNK